MTLAMAYDVTFKQGPFTGEEIQAQGLGGCDALLFVSMIFPPDGSASFASGGFDGRTGGPLADVDVARAWMNLTYNVSRAEGTPEWMRAIARDAHNSIRLHLTADRQDRNAPSN